MISTFEPDKPCDRKNYVWQGEIEFAPEDWRWFHCINAKRCIHIDSRCDLHPNPECIYEKAGIRVAEDEEGCFDEYKRKGLVAKSAKMICSSPDHNNMSPIVTSNNFNGVQYYFNVTVIPSGTTVQIQG